MATKKPSPQPSGQMPQDPSQDQGGQYPPQGPVDIRLVEPTRLAVDAGLQTPLPVTGTVKIDGPVPVQGPEKDGSFRVTGPGPGGSFRINGPGPEGSFRVSGLNPDGTFPFAAPPGPLDVRATLQRSDADPSDDQAFWVAIRNSTASIGFENYSRFINRVLCREDTTDGEDALLADRRPTATARLHFGVDAYQLLKAATEAFLILRCGIHIDRGTYRESEERSRLGHAADFGNITSRLSDYLGTGLPYIKTVLSKLRDEIDEGDIGLPFCDTLLNGNPYQPCLLELIWSYWHEEGMLVQAINAISLRFQNKSPSDRNPLTQLELSPLRPLSNLLWGYIQDEPFRLTVARRAQEYGHHYGLNLVGKAVPSRRPADNRSKFLEAFHSLLRRAAAFYKEDSDTTVIADGFPILNALQEVHMLLAEGAHNQFRDLPWTARVEMLVHKWLLSRSEMQEFLRGRAMVPYKEAWMGPVDTLRHMLGWGDTPVTHFRDLAVYGEQILLSIRYGDWVNVNDQNQAKNWARYWKPEIQSYIHAYRAATGVDLGIAAVQEGKVDATLPSVLLQRRMAQGAR